MYPHERSLVKQLADKPFAIVGVNSDGDLEEIRKIVKEKNLTWRSFQNEQKSGEIAGKWGIRGWPTIFLLDQEGRIRYRDIRGDELDQAIEVLLKETGHTVEISHEQEEKDAEEQIDQAEGSDSDKQDSKN